MFVKKNLNCLAVACHKKCNCVQMFKIQIQIRCYCLNLLSEVIEKSRNKSGHKQTYVKNSRFPLPVQYLCDTFEFTR